MIRRWLERQRERRKERWDLDLRQQLRKSWREMRPAATDAQIDAWTEASMQSYRIHYPEKCK